MRWLKLLYLGLGALLLVLVLARVDLQQALAESLRVGVWGMLVLLGLYFAAFVIDSFTWQMAVLRLPLSPRWLYRLWKVRMVGEVFNNVLPAAGMGGEPLKADLLKRYYGVPYREGVASIILGKSINFFAMVIFLAAGFVLMWDAPELGVGYRLLAGAGLAAFGLGMVLFYAVQRWRLTSLAGTWLARFRFTRRLETVLHHIHDMDERLVTFYTRHHVRFLAAVALALVNWVLGVAEVWVAMHLLGHPVSWADAWIIEAATQLVRNGAFFIPAAIGVQEGAFMVLCTAITGSPTVGLAVAVVRRVREVLWLVWGAVLGSLFGLKPRHADADSG